MLGQRTRIELIVACAVVSVAVIVGVIVTREPKVDNPITQERIASEMVGDGEMAACVYDGLKERRIPPNVLNQYLDGSSEVEQNQIEVDGISEVVTECSSASLVGPGAPAANDQSDAGELQPSDGADVVTETTLPPPIIQINEDGSAEVIWVPSTEMVRIDPQIPEAASNRAP